jgi:hypothetical protein
MQIQRIFVVGNSRSGTKLMGKCLGRHSQVHTFKEMHFFDQMVSEPGEQLKSARVDKLLKKLFLTQKTDAEIPDKLYVKKDYISAQELYLRFQQIILAGKNKTIACDPTPRNLFCARELNIIYPASFFIVLNRDLRAVLWSQKNKWKLIKTGKQPNRFEMFRLIFNYHPVITSYIWKKSVREANKLAGELGDAISVLKYEDFILNPSDILNKITDQCRVGFEKEMLNIRVLNTSDVTRLRVPGFDKSRIDAWKDKLSKTDIWIGQQICKKELNGLGYSFMKIHPNLLVLIAKLILLPLQWFFSVLFNVIKAWKIVFFLKKKIFGLS